VKRYIIILNHTGWRAYRRN